MKCIVCKKELAPSDAFYSFSDIASGNECNVCEDCGAVTSLYNLYSNDFLTLNSSDDNAIDVEATVSDVIDVEATVSEN